MRRTNRWATAAVCLLWCLCAACSNVGQPLVDTRLTVEESSDSVVLCPSAPPCDAPLDNLSALHERVTLAALERDFTTCGSGVRPTCTLDEDDAGLPLDPIHCVPSVIDIHSLDAHSAGCADLRIEAGPTDTDTIVADVQWTHANVRIAATEPWSLTLNAPRLDDVFIELLGPVTLHVVGAASCTSVHLAGGPQTAHSRLDFTQTSCADTVIGSAAAPYAGTITSVRSKFSNSSAELAALRLESSAIEQSTLAVDTLSAIDTAFDGVNVKLGRGVVSGCVLEQVDFTDCQSLLLTESHSEVVRIAACRDEPLRMYGGDLRDGFIDGDVQADTSVFGGVVFGRFTPTRVLQWAGNFSACTFCAHAEQAVFGDGAQVTCNECPAGLGAGDAACAVPGASPLFNNACEALKAPPLCKAPLPQRERRTGNATAD